MKGAGRMLVPCVVILGLAAALAGCTQTDEGPPSAEEGTASVIMKDVKFQPATIEVAVNTTVTWTNRDDVEHTVTPDDKELWGAEGSGDDPDQWLGTGASWSHVFTKPGTYTYHCIPHAAKSGGAWRGMVGTVIVT